MGNCQECDGDCDRPEDYVRSTSSRAQQKSTALYLIRSIVESKGGTIEIDMATNTINIDVSKEKEVACAQEIEEAVSALLD